MTLLDLRGELPSGRLVIEASAGTGKTYSLSALVVRHVAERNREASDLLLVTFTRAAAAELRDRTRGALVAAEAAVRTGVVPADQAWMSVLLDAPEEELIERGRRLREAVRSFDDATITTIHGFCQTALRQLGLRSGAAIDTELTNHQPLYVEEVCRDLVVEALHRDPHALDWPTSRTAVHPDMVLKQLEDAVSAVLGNRGIRVVPEADCLPGPGDTADRLARWVGLVHTAVRLVGERQRARQEMGYDELINGLHDAVVDPLTGPQAVATLRSRYQLVLVDEFQDTDAIQWTTFATIFDGCDLITVGDPKQAIYRFRGADVFAYLQAVEGAPTVRLGTNFRSDAHLVEATNRFLGGVRLGDPRIAVAPVAAAPSAPARTLSPGAPFVVRRLPRHPKVCSDNGEIQAGKADRVIIDDVVRVTVGLLQDHRLTPGDVAVLVRSNPQAGDVVDALVAAGVPAVRARTGSVLNSPAKDHLERLLGALENPAHAAVVRNAGLGVFFRHSAAELDPAAADPVVAAANEARLAELQRRCAVWADLLTRSPFLAWYDTVRADAQLSAALLRTPMGERDLTDLDHLAELLAAELGAHGATAASVRRMLARLVSTADDKDPGPQMRRIDSDAQAVQVSTVHGSKGLEYPVVLLPFAWKEPYSTPPYEYHTPDGRRTIDIASDQGWTGTSADEWPDGRKHHARVGTLGDDLRLLYVALTRAQHRTVLWWAPMEKCSEWGLDKVLFDRDATGLPRHTEPSLTEGPDGEPIALMPGHLPPSDEAVDAAFESLRRRAVLDGDALIDVEVVPVDAPRARWRSPEPASPPPPLRVADTRGRGPLANPAWRRWSFTGITKDRHEAWVPAMPTIGGTDEPEPEPDELGAAITQLRLDMPWADVPGGTAFGTLVHEVLEHVDPTSPALADQVHDEVWSRSSGGHLLAPPADVVNGLLAAMHTPMGPLVDDLRLVDIGAADRLAELDFDMPLSSGRVVSAPQVGDLLLATLPADDPQREYAQVLAAGRFPTDLQGYLAGSIDAVLRIHGADGPRFVVVDYKTNTLHTRDATDPLQAYRPDRLPAAMADADYPLQSILYSVALHRFLRWRLGAAYRPEQHLGGIAYLFLRGMVGAATPVDGQGRRYGVFAWRPPAATVVALDRLLATGEAP